MGEHAPLSPSASERWIACPGSVKLSVGIESPDSVHSRLGTFAHSIAQRTLNDHDWNPAKSLVGQSDGEFTVDEEMAELIQTYVEVVQREVLVRGGDVYIEQKVVISDDCWGTADAILFADDGTLHVFDLKFGAGHYVEAEGNPQLLTYAAGALFYRATFHCTEVHLHIVQPRGRGEPHRVWVQRHPQVLDWVAETLRPAIRKTQWEEPPLATGDHCKWCPARGVCPKLREEALAVFPDLEANPKKAVATMTDEALMRAFEMADVVELWISATRAEAAARAGSRKLPGYKLVQKLGNRKWADKDTAAKALAAAGVDPWEPAEIISPAQAEERAGKGGEALVAPLTVRPVTGTVLVKDTDPRPAIDRAEVFSQIENKP